MAASPCHSMSKEICTQANQLPLYESVHPDSLKLASSSLTIADEPIWVLQCLLLIIVNGTKSASFRTFQEAVSLTSLLIEVRIYESIL
jgi:hypothetical protein